MSLPGVRGRYHAKSTFRFADVPEAKRLLGDSVRTSEERGNEGSEVVILRVRFIVGDGEPKAIDFRLRRETESRFGWPT